MSFSNGQRVVDPNDGQHSIWLIDSGFRRLIANPINVNLFIDMIGVISDPGIVSIPIGLPMPTSAALQAASGTNAIYLVESSSCRRVVISPTVFSRWRFNPSHVQPTDSNTLLGIPCGPDIT